MTEEIQEARQPAEAFLQEGGGTVGQTLRAAREAASLTVADVAQSLKFSSRQIEQLEADDYASLPGATIVRGFARSYARLLKLDADALLRLLDDRTPNTPADVRPPENMGVASQPSGLRQISPLASVAIVLILVTLLLALWHFFGPKPNNPAAEQVADSGQSNHGGQGAAQQTAVTVPLPAVVPAAAADQTPAAASPAAADAGTAQPQPALPTLLFVIAERSWIEVTDARKQVLHTGESPAGSRLTLSGQPPFDLVVGNAGKVKLTYGEREIDLAPHTRAEVARLKLE